jgi:hypothetical protein
MTADEPVDECGMCGADLYPDVPHDCPVGGNVVLITARDDARDDAREARIRRYVRRIHALEAGIARFLEAEEAGEMGNRDKAIEHLEHLMEA